MNKKHYRTPLLAAVLAALLLLSTLAMSACAIAKADSDKTPPESDGVRVTGKETKTKPSDEQLYRYEFEDEIAYVGVLPASGDFAILTENAELNAAFIEMLKNMRLTKLDEDEYWNSYVYANYWDDYEEHSFIFALYSADGAFLGCVSYTRALDENSDALLWSPIDVCSIPTLDDSFDHGTFFATPETFDIELIEQFYQECTNGLGFEGVSAKIEAEGTDGFFTTEDVRALTNYEPTESRGEFPRVFAVPVDETESPRAGEEAGDVPSDEQLYRYEFEDEIAYVGIKTVLGGPVVFTEDAELNAAFIEMIDDMRLIKIDDEEYHDSYVETNYWADYEECSVVFLLYSAEGEPIGFVSFSRALDGNSNVSRWSQIDFCPVSLSDGSIDHWAFSATPETFDAELIEQFYQECTHGLGADSVGALFKSGGGDEFLTKEDIKPIINYEARKSNSEYLHLRAFVVPVDETESPRAGEEAGDVPSDEQLYRYEFEDEIAYVGVKTVGGPVVFTEDAELNAAFIEMIENMRLTKLDEDEYWNSYVYANYWDDYAERSALFLLYSSDGAHLGFVTYNRALDENSDASLWSPIVVCSIPTLDDSFDHGTHGTFFAMPETFDIELIEQFYQECTHGLGSQAAAELLKAGSSDEFLTEKDIKVIAEHEKIKSDGKLAWVFAVPVD